MYLAVLLGKFVQPVVTEWCPSTTGPLLPTMTEWAGYLVPTKARNCNLDTEKHMHKPFVSGCEADI